MGPSSVNVLLYCSLAVTQTCCSILVTQSPCFLNESKAAERCLVSRATKFSSKFSWKAICLLPIKQSVHELYRGFELTKQMSPSRWQPQPSSAQEPELAGRLVCWPLLQPLCFTAFLGKQRNIHSLLKSCILRKEILPGPYSCSKSTCL